MASDPIEAEIEVSQRWALRQHFCKPFCIFSFGGELEHLNLKMGLIYERFASVMGECVM